MLPLAKREQRSFAERRREVHSDRPVHETELDPCTQRLCACAARLSLSPVVSTDYITAVTISTLQLTDHTRLSGGIATRAAHLGLL